MVPQPARTTSSTNFGDDFVEHPDGTCTITMRSPRILVVEDYTGAPLLPRIHVPDRHAPRNRHERRARSARERRAT